MKRLLVVISLPWEASGRVRRLIGWSGKQFEMSQKEEPALIGSKWEFTFALALQRGCTDGEKQNP